MSIEAYALRVDGQVCPSGVVNSPRFTWRQRSAQSGVQQVAYRLVVERVGADGQSVAVWDTGRVSSTVTASLPYSGQPLSGSSDYVWHLEVEDNRGDRAATESSFATGILDPGEWKAAWIGRNPIYSKTALPPQDTDISYTVNKLTPVRRFVRHFDLDKVSRAKVHVSAKGHYRLYVNGVRVGNDELAPGWTEYADRITYQSWDVSAHVRVGRNSVAALLADGWYAGFIGTDRRHQAQHYGEEAELLVQFMTDDGMVVATDETWKESPSEILYADMLMGQYEDSRLADPGWHLPSTELSNWSDAVVVDRDVSLLVPECDPGVRVGCRVTPVGVDPREGGRFVVDFGQNLVGHVRLRLRGQGAGRRVQLRHAEVCEHGELYTANLRTAEPVDVFWTNGDDEQVFEPRFTLHGFRFVEVGGLAGDLDAGDIEAVVVHSAADRVGRFSSSSPELDRLFQNICWSLRGNFVSIPTDCPQRDERLGWLADVQVFASTALAIMDVGPLLRRWMRDVRSAQDADGAFPDIAPQLIHRREGAPAWGDGGVTVPWQVYRAGGDIRVLEEAVDSMVAWVRHIERHNPDLVWRHRVGNNYGDWLQVGEETPREVLATAYFARSADLTQRTLALLGRAEEASQIADLHQRVCEAYRRAFVGADGVVHGDSQGAYLLTLAFGLCRDQAERDRVAERLVEAVIRRDTSLTTGFITVGLLCPVLADCGREDLAFRLLHNDRYPSWLFSVRNGATTIWERWDGWTKEHGFQSPRMNSFNHYALGSVGQWFISGILGITQTEDSAGYQELVLGPRFDPFLDHAEGSLETPRGRVESAWRREDNRVVWTVVVPPGGPAQVSLPHSLAEVSVRCADGVVVNIHEVGPDGNPRLFLESGRYEVVGSVGR